jgi:Peroxiredoxin
MGLALLLAASLAFEPTDLDGRTVGLEDARGDVVVLNFWATWCKPCIEEMPSLARLHQTFSGRGVRVIAVSADAPGAAEAVRSFVDERKLPFTVWLGATTDSMESFGLKPVLPGTVVLDREGKVRARFDGQFDEDALESAIEDALRDEGADTLAAAEPPRRKRGPSRVPT